MGCEVPIAVGILNYYNSVILEAIVFEEKIKKDMVVGTDTIEEVSSALIPDSTSYLFARPTPKEELDDVFDDEDIINNIESLEIIGYNNEKEEILVKKEDLISITINQEGKILFNDKVINISELKSFTEYELEKNKDQITPGQIGES